MCDICRTQKVPLIPKDRSSAARCDLFADLSSNTSQALIKLVINCLYSNIINIITLIGPHNPELCPKDRCPWDIPYHQSILGSLEGFEAQRVEHVIHDDELQGGLMVVGGGVMVVMMLQQTQR